jgi:hypothetical protein
VLPGKVTPVCLALAGFRLQQTVQTILACSCRHWCARRPTPRSISQIEIRFLLGGHDTVPVAINNRDEIVGLFTDAAGLTHAFTLLRGIFTQFDPPGTVGFSAAFGINAQGWLLNDAEIAEVRRLTLGNQKKQVADWKPARSERIGIDPGLLSFDSFSILIDRYIVRDIDSLRAKLAQFPAGTHFVIFHFHSVQEDRRWSKIIDTIHETAQEHGFQVEMGVSW